MNNTNQTVTLRRGYQTVSLNSLDNANIISLLETKLHHVEEGELEQANVPEDFRVLILIPCQYILIHGEIFQQ